jgi:NAD(P)-dependent dehydrogenase (short-subunit alcohol dehydrogenase family)
MEERKVAIITGASDGIGAQAARQLSRAGWLVVIVGRSPQKTMAVARELNAPYYLADFADLEQVRSLAQSLIRDFPRIDVLCNNAGGMFKRRELSRDGHEMTFQVNHLAPFLLTRWLMDTLIKNHASVIATSSVAHKAYSLYRPDDLELRHRHAPHLSYGNSKLANILFTRELHRRFHAQGLSSAAFHPGLVTSHFAADTKSPLRLIYRSRHNKLLGFINSDEGADTLVWLARHQPGTDWQSGGYYYQRKLTQPSRKAQSDELALRLWEDSMEMLTAFLPETTA